MEQEFRSSIEQVRKLALLYAVSENNETPRISLTAAEWATRFVLHQTRRMLFMAYNTWKTVATGRAADADDAIPAPAAH